MLRYLVIILFLFVTPVPAVSQVEAVDTSALIMLLMGPDSVNFRRDISKLEKDICCGTQVGLAESYQNVGQYFLNHGQPTHALRYFLAALKNAEASGDKERIAWALNGVAQFYKARGDRETSMKYSLRALDIFKSIKHVHGIGSMYNSIGDIYEWKADYPNAHKNYFASLNTLRNNAPLETLTWPYYNIGEVYMYQGRYDSARIYLDSCLAVQLEVKNRGTAGWTYNNIASLLVRQKKFDEALPYATLALHIADSIKEPGAAMNANRTLHTIYEAKGDYKAALHHYKLLTELTAGSFDAENTKKAVSMQMQYDFDKQKEFARLEQDKKDIRTKAIAIGLLLLCLVAIVAFYLQRRSNKLKAELLKQQQKSIEQKEMMMKEIHHRVKNNLQVTGTLLDLQLTSITDEKARVAISESITRLNAISLIHHQLYSGDQGSAIEFSQFATELYIQLHNLFAGQNKQVTFANKLPELLLDIDTAVPLGLILNELLTNSYKHAFSDTGGSITLGLDKAGGQYTLTYTDSGKGLPADIDPAKLKSLGMMIIQSLARQIGGSFVYTPGTAIFMVRFRDAAEMKRTA